MCKFAFAKDLSRYLSPDKSAEAFILGVPYANQSDEWTESILVFRDYITKSITSKDLTSGDSEHGLFFVSGKWTPDSNYFIATSNSSGGHSPWQFRTFIYDRKANSVIWLTDYTPAIVSPDFAVKSPDILHIKVKDDTLPEPTDGKYIDIKLSEALKQKDKAQQDAAANP